MGSKRVNIKLISLEHEKGTDVWQYMLQNDGSVAENGGVSEEKVACGCLCIRRHVLFICECLMHSRGSNEG